MFKLRSIHIDTIPYRNAEDTFIAPALDGYVQAFEDDAIVRKQETGTKIYRRLSGDLSNQIIYNLANHQGQIVRITAGGWVVTSGSTFNHLSLYMAPEKHMDVYLQEMIFESQKCATKQLGVDTARYYFRVDKQDDTIHTGGDGYWGSTRKSPTTTKAIPLWTHPFSAFACRMRTPWMTCARG